MDEKFERLGSLNKNFLIRVTIFNIKKNILNSISYFNTFSPRKYGHKYRDILYMYGYGSMAAPRIFFRGVIQIRVEGVDNDLFCK